MAAELFPMSILFVEAIYPAIKQWDRLFPSITYIQATIVPLPVCWAVSSIWPSQREYILGRRDAYQTIPLPWESIPHGSCTGTSAVVWGKTVAFEIVFVSAYDQGSI